MRFETKINRASLFAIASIFLLLFTCTVVSPVIGTGIEFDSLAVARQFADPEWISADWYLNQPIGYRYLFNGIFGGLVRVLPIAQGVFLARIILVLLYTVALFFLCKNYGIPLGALLVGMILFLNHQSYFAHELMINGLESKTFAYALVLLAMAMAPAKRYKLMWIFLGIALSFHLLVGGYGAATLGLWFVYRKYFESDDFTWKKVFGSAYLFGIFGLFGLLAIMTYFFQRADVDGDLASSIYIWRVWHHVNPINRSHGISEWNLFRIAISVIGLGLILIILRRFHAGNGINGFIAMILGSTVFFLIGTLADLLHITFIMKLYLFRFPDTMVPFTFFIGGFSTLLLFFPNISVLKKNPLIHKVKYDTYAFFNTSYAFLDLLLILAAFCISMVQLPATIADVFDAPESGLTYNETSEFDFYTWIRENTLKNSSFLISPNDLGDFYFKAERPRFVSFGHSPQTDPYIIEWYERLIYAYGNHKPDLKAIYKDVLPALEENFENLSLDYLQDGKEKYGYQYYVTQRQRPDLKEQLVYDEGYRYIYKIN